MDQNNAKTAVSAEELAELTLPDFPVEDARKLIEIALWEDVREGDFTSKWTLPVDQSRTARLIAKEDGVLAGMPFIALVFEALNEAVNVQCFVQDGQAVKKGDVLAEITGTTQALLTGERTFLNFLQQLSGVASMVAEYQSALAGSKTKILDTRKTLPGYRRLQKYAVRAGGGENHRMGLFDMVLIKDNHIQATGSPLDAVRTVQAHNDRGLKIECEVETLDQLRSLLHQGVDVIMLDNMDTPTMAEAVKIVRESGDSVKLEASGNMTLERVAELRDLNLDYISVGALTHSVKAMDISLRIPEQGVD